MTQETLMHFGISIFGWGLAIGTMRAALNTLGKRVDKLEDCEEKRPQNYVPRLELQSKIDAIHEKVLDTNRLIHLALGHRRREVETK